MSRGLPATAGVLVLAFGMGWLAHLAQVRVDEGRHDLAGASANRVLPDPATLRAAGMGQPTLLADLMWVRVALNFADIVERPTQDGPRWIQLMLESVVALDPTWRTPYFYGGSMLRVLENIDGSDAIFRSAMAAHPTDPYFPFSVGMNAYLYRQDPAEAARMLSLAAELPGAPPWYRAAAAGFLDEHGQRRAALAYLEEQLEAEEEPAVREALETKYRQVAHDELSANLTDRKRELEAELGAEILSVEQLPELPPDPLGAGWIVAPDGVVRSARDEERLARELRDKERAMLTTRR